MSGDDAAGLAVANAYRSDVAVLNQGIRNANDGLSTLQIKDGALNNISTLLDRLATLATQSASRFDDRRSRTTLQQRVPDVSSSKSTAKRRSPASTRQAGFSVFVSNDGTNGIVGGSLACGRPRRPSASTSLDINDIAAAQTAVATLTTAVDDARLGAGLGRHAGEPPAVRHQPGAVADSRNKQAAESRIRDANIAEESANLTRYNILTQSGIAALAQANQSSAAVLSLLR